MTEPCLLHSSNPSRPDPTTKIAQPTRDFSRRDDVLVSLHDLEQERSAGMKRWISFPRREGIASRQAHTNQPPGTFEREFGKEGFFGPVTQMYHAHPPTGWSDWSGSLRPRAFDLNKLDTAQAS